VRYAYARHDSKNRQANTYYLAVDAWRRHVSPDEGIPTNTIMHVIFFIDDEFLWR
jgi:hypothetical protein